MKFILVVLSFCLFLGACSTSRILCILPVPAKSHAILVETLCREMATRKHDVTALTVFPPSKPLENYKEITLNLTGSVQERMNIFETRKLYSAFSMLVFIMGFVPNSIEECLSHPKTKELLASDEKFDLILTENYISESIIGGFGHRFNAPVVTLSVIMANLWSNYQVGNPAPIAYIPDPFLGKHSKMSLMERTGNFVYDCIHRAIYFWYYLPLQDRIMRKHFGPDLPPIRQLIQNVSFQFVNHHHSMSFPRAYVPNFVEIGGMHVKPPQPLPEDLQIFLDNATNGAILFSLGSVVRSVDLPHEKLDIFKKVFGSVKLPVIWKWESDHFDGKPRNVKIRKWLPQADILAHPNVKLFVTHGGFGSMLESVYHGVPIVGIPIFAEQPLNLKMAEHVGYGIKVDFDTMTVEGLSSAINEVLTNSKYRNEAQHRSILLKDTPIKAMDNAMFWIDYVIRHKGAPHLRSEEQNLSWYQLHLLDVYAVLATLLFSIFIFNYLLFKMVKAICSKAKRKTKKETKKQK